MGVVALMYIMQEPTWLIMWKAGGHFGLGPHLDLKTWMEPLWTFAMALETFVDKLVALTLINRIFFAYNDNVYFMAWQNLWF